MSTDQEKIGNDMQLEIEKVSEMVSAARRLLTEGKSVDLVALEHEVDDLCQAIHAKPPQNSREVRQALANIVNDLDSLEHEITEQHRQLEKNLAERTRKLAIEAYSDPTDTEGETKNGKDNDS